MTAIIITPASIKDIMLVLRFLLYFALISWVKNDPHRTVASVLNLNQ